MLKKRKSKKESETIETLDSSEEMVSKEAPQSGRGFKIYVVFLVILSIAFAAHLVFNFYIEPRSLSGSPILGNRLEYLSNIPENVFTDTEAFGLTQTRVEAVTVSHIGAIIYFNVRVEAGTGVEVARTAAEEISDFFLEQAGELAEGYNIQLVVSTGDIDELKAENRAEALDHVRRHQMNLVEELTIFAEQFPTTDATVGSNHGTIDRVLSNISLLRRRQAYTEKVGELYQVYETALADFEARVNALTPLTNEEVEVLIEQNHGNILVRDITDIRDVPQSDITDFPSWGALNNTTGLIEWN